jgi:hypothetical protein
LIRYSEKAIDRIDALGLHYIHKTRLAAAMALDWAIEQTEQTIAMQPGAGAGLSAPRYILPAQDARGLAGQEKIAGPCDLFPPRKPSLNLRI